MNTNSNIISITTINEGSVYKVYHGIYKIEWEKSDFAKRSAGWLRV